MAVLHHDVLRAGPDVAAPDVGLRLLEPAAASHGAHGVLNCRGGERLDLARFQNTKSITVFTQRLIKILCNLNYKLEKGNYVIFTCRLKRKL